MMRLRISIVLLAIILMEGTIMPGMAQDGSRSRPMEQAILTGEVETVRGLVEAGADVNERMFRRETPTLMAASVGAWDIVLYLLEQGADPASQNMSGTTLSAYVTDSLVAPDTREGEARERVRQMLVDRGLF